MASLTADLRRSRRLRPLRRFVGDHRWALMLTAIVVAFVAPPVWNDLVPHVHHATVASVSAGHDRTCAVRTDRTVACWGGAARGVGLFGWPSDEPNPTAVAGATNAVSVSMGQRQACALRTDGAVMCWGGNRNGELGNGTRTSSTSAVLVKGLKDAVSVVAGYDHSCAIRRAGTVVCWGANGDGELGDGTRHASTTPVAVRGLRGVYAIALGWRDSCALRRAGTVACWGSNYQGQLGPLDHQVSARPVDIPGLHDVTQIDTSWKTTCAVERGGTVACWGLPLAGPKALSGPRLGTARPVAVPGLGNARTVAVGMHHACAVVAGASVVCWGLDVHGALGRGTDSEQAHLRPAPVVGLAHVVGLDAGATHTCATSANGRAWCWGENVAGELGNGRYWHADDALTGGDEFAVARPVEVLS